MTLFVGVNDLSVGQYDLEIFDVVATESDACGVECVTT
jgi:hypothetical protein